PTGVAARDLLECLLLQIGHLRTSTMGSLGARPGALKGSIVEAIVQHHLKDLEKKQYARIAKPWMSQLMKCFRRPRSSKRLSRSPDDRIRTPRTMSLSLTCLSSRMKGNGWSY